MSGRFTGVGDPELLGHRERLGLQLHMPSSGLKLIHGLAVFMMLVAVGAGLSACGGEDEKTAEQVAPPTPVITPAEIMELENEATTFAEQHMGAWPDVDAFVADFAEDLAFADPTWSDYRVGGENIGAMLEQWARVTDYTIEVTGNYMSADGGAFEETWPGLQPPLPLPPDPPVTRGLEVFRFRDGQIVGNDMWYPPDDNEVFGLGCFAVDGCPALEETVDRYVEAWASRDSGSIAALYSDQAVFIDSLMGLDPDDAAAIGDLGDERFGSDGDLIIEVIDVYAWTHGRRPPTESNPDVGRLIGVAIHYRAAVDDGTTTWTQEAVTTLELGERSTSGFEPDPEGLIHREDVYHEPSSLLANVSP
jgi:ketosteroid isomerase-like protein